MSKIIYLEDVLKRKQEKENKKENEKENNIKLTNDEETNLLNPMPYWTWKDFKYFFHTAEESLGEDGAWEVLSSVIQLNLLELLEIEYNKEIDNEEKE